VLPLSPLLNRHLWLVKLELGPLLVLEGTWLGIENLPTPWLKLFMGNKMLLLHKSRKDVSNPVLVNLVSNPLGLVDFVILIVLLENLLLFQAQMRNLKLQFRKRFLLIMSLILMLMLLGKQNLNWSWNQMWKWRMIVIRVKTMRMRMMKVISTIGYHSHDAD
jgi:hypothetical protein